MKALTYVELFVDYCSHFYSDGFWGASTAGVTLSSSDTVATRTAGAGAYTTVLSAASFPRGSVHAEIVATTITTPAEFGIGVASQNFTGLTDTSVYLGNNNSIALYANGTVWLNRQNIGTGPTYTSGQKVAVEFNLSDNTIRWAVNGGAYSAAFSLASFRTGSERMFVGATQRTNGESVRILSSAEYATTVTGGYSTGGCQAKLGVTGAAKCFNSRNTCQDITNFVDQQARIRFAVGTNYLPKEIDCIPNITDVKFTPSTITPGEGLGGRASLEVSFRDSPHSDTGTGFDRYAVERSYNPYRQGTLFGKMHARHPYLQGRTVRLIRGLLGQVLADMDTRTFILDDFDGPDFNGVFTLTAKDVLKLADGEKAQAPNVSTGSLGSAIDNVQTSMILSPAGVGNLEYPSTGFINISEEIVGFTRVGNATLLIHGDSPSPPVDATATWAIVPNGNTFCDTSQKMFGTASVRLDGSGDFMNVNVSGPTLAFGTGDFVFDCWCRWAVTPTTWSIFEFRASTSDVASHLQVTGGVFTYSIGLTLRITGTVNVSAINTWFHVMVSRANGTTRLFVNGSQDGSSYVGADNLVIPASRPFMGANTSQVAAVNGWLDEIRIAKGVGVINNFTVPAAPYVIGLSDSCTITRAQLGTTAQAHALNDRAQLCVRYLGVNPANIISDLLQTYAGVPSSYIPLSTWVTEIQSFLGVVYTGTIAEPTAVNALIAELCDIGGLAIWWDDKSQQIKLQVLRQIATSARLYTDADRLDGTLKVEEQIDKRLSQIWTYFGQLNPTKNLDQIDNYSSMKVTIDSAAEANWSASAIKKRYTRWVAVGGSAVASSSNQVQLSRFVIPPRRFNFELFREYNPSQDPVLGSGYQLSSWIFQDPTGAREIIPIQITRMNPEADRFEIEAEEMRFQAIVTDPFNRTIIIDANTFNVNLKAMHDSLFAPITSGVTLTVIVQPGVIVGSANTATPAMDIGAGWPGGVTIVLSGQGRIQGAGGKGGGRIEAQAGVGGRPGGTALFTPRVITISMGGGQIWSGGGGGGGYGGLGGGVGGGGGGAGSVPGVGGPGDPSPSFDGLPGTTEAGGVPGAGAATGGGPGLAGIGGLGGTAVGGAAGAAIDGNHFVTFSGTPNIRGGQIN